MITINLDPTFDPFCYVSSGNCGAKIFNFSSGFEPHIKLLNKVAGVDVLIVSRFKDGNDLMLIVLAADAARRAGAASISLFIPFIPFARQDDMMDEGEPISIVAFADIINLQGFKKVIMFDPHSNASSLLIKNSHVIKNHGFVGDILAGKGDYRLVSPDAGAYKKIFPLAMHLGKRMGGQNEIVICEKVRDRATGKILRTTVNVTDLKGQDVYIVDDIIDGGRTFIAMAEELEKCNCGDKYLIVSHYIGSQGEDELKKYFKHIYTTNSVKDVKSDFVIQTSMVDILTDCSIF
jgi:ribose-phosphate pyrophosphokinase